MDSTKPSDGSLYGHRGHKNLHCLNSLSVCVFMCECVCVQPSDILYIFT